MAGSDMLLKCGICLTYYTEPKILPCFHTFCLKCLESNVQLNDQSGQFPCPICRASITIPDGGVRCFQTNFYIQTRDSSLSELDCDACGSSQTAKFQCKQCEQKFCACCAERHVRMNSSGQHDLISVLPEKDRMPKPCDVKPSCKVHPQEKITLICKDCNELVCHICNSTSHKEHSCKTTSAEAKEKRKQLKEYIEEAESNLHEIEKDTQVVTRQAESKRIYFNEQIIHLTRQRDLLISNINKKFKAFEDKINQLNEEQVMLSNEVIENKKLTTDTFKRAIDSSKEIGVMGNDISLLRNFDDLAEKLQEIEVSLCPAVPGHELMEALEICTKWIIKLKKLNDEL